MAKDPKDYAKMMRDRLNKNSGKDLVTSVDERTQIDSWVEMRQDFKEIVGGEGIPQGHITQIYSEEPDSGKTTELITVMVEAQKQGGIVNLIDSEQKFPWERFEAMGGDIDAINHIEVDSLEEAWDAWDSVGKSSIELREAGFDNPIVAAWDSIPASIPDAIMGEKDAGKAHVAVEAKINNKNVRKLRQMIRRAKLTAIFINHSYWTMPQFPQRPEEKLKGGAEMYFMTTLAIKYKKGKKLYREFRGENQRIGQTVHVEVKKGHFSGRTIKKTLNIIETGFVSDEELKEYKASLKGKI